MRYADLSVCSVIKRFGISRCKIKKPKEGSEVFPLLTAASSESPSLLQMSLRLLKLPKGLITPVHWHDRREKLYILLGPGMLDIIIYDGSEWIPYILSPHTIAVVVNAGKPHCIYAREEATVLVVSSDLNPNDIFWEESQEPNTHEMVKCLP